MNHRRRACSLLIPAQLVPWGQGLRVTGHGVHSACFRGVWCTACFQAFTRCSHSALSLLPPYPLPGTLLGGITFRNVLVRYDRGARRVGFGHAACKTLGQEQRPPCSALEREGIPAVRLGEEFRLGVGECCAV